MLKIKTLPKLPQPHPVAACTSLCLHSLNFEMLVNIHCFHFLTSHSSLTLFRLPPPHSTQRILISGSLTPNQIDGLAPILPLPQHNFPFLFCCTFYMRILCFQQTFCLSFNLIFLGTKLSLLRKFL